MPEKEVKVVENVVETTAKNQPHVGHETTESNMENGAVPSGKPEDK